MPQAIWKGAVSFGMVSIPVRVFAATEEKDVRFRQMHAADGGRIRYRRVCEIDGEEVPYSDIAKGYELPDGEMMILTPEDFDDLPLPSKQVVDVLEFVPSEQIDPIYVGRSYYLQPESSGAKPYVLLRDALVSTGQVALVKVALRNRETLAMLRAVDDVLLMQAMLWPDEVRDAGFATPEADVEVRDSEIAMAESYIETLSADFDPERYHDEYRHALEQLIEAKTEGRAVETVEEPDSGGEVVDLMAALRASVDEAKKRRGDRDGASGGVRDGSDTANGSATGTSATSKASKTGVSAKSAKSAKSTQSEKPAKTSKTSKTSKTAKTAKTADVATAARSTKSEAKPEKSAKPAKPAKPAKSAKSARSARSTKSSSAQRAKKTASTKQTTRDGAQQAERSAHTQDTSAGRRKRSA